MPSNNNHRLKPWVGFGPHKVDPRLLKTRDRRRQNNRERFHRALDRGTTVAFVGSGCSAPLGYPTWPEFVAKVVDQTLRMIQHEDDVKRLTRFKTRLAQEPRPGSDRLLFMLGACQAMLAERQETPSYYEFLRNLFTLQEQRAEAPNPYTELLKLPIHRFVTSNYDGELTRALERCREVGRRRQRPSPSTFAYGAGHHDGLASICLAGLREMPEMVFHCHGLHGHPASMIVTEDDYQRLYFGESAEALGFRQTIDLLFGSNSVLFVGFGLTDEDLVRPLRRFVSIRPELRSTSELFALLPQANEEDHDYFDQLHERYGIITVTYAASTATDPDARGKALCEALSGIEKDHTIWRDDWLSKPYFLKADVSAYPPDPYRHHGLDPGAGSSFDTIEVKELLDGLEAAAQGGEAVEGAAATAARLIVLIGPGGTGKSWSAMKLLDRIEKNRGRFEGSFFWSSYYTDDALTGIDRALAYLDPRGQHSGSRFDRLKSCLKASQCLLVFDGIERLMRETSEPEVGLAHDSIAGEFFRLLAEPLGLNTIVLTSRLWPQELGDISRPSMGVLCRRVPPFRANDLMKGQPFSWLTRDPDPHPHVAELCSLLEGHAHAIVLAARVLAQGGPEGFEERLQALCRRLARAAPGHRLWHMTGEALRTLDEKHGGLATRLLERVAIFMGPVTEPVLEICYASAANSLRTTTGTAPSSQEQVVQALLESHLLHRVATSPERRPGILEQAQELRPYAVPVEGSSAYTSHPIVRGYVFLRMHGAASAALPNLTLPGYTAATALADPGTPESVAMVMGVLDKLCEAADQAQQSDPRRAHEVCRGAFSVVRSRMVSNAVPRWGHYDRFLHYIVRVADLARRLAPQRWRYAERLDIGKVEHPNAPLYAEEVAWLYNEAGLASYASGAVADAVAAWEQGHEINSVVDSFPDGGQYLFQSQCNLGAAFLEQGRLDTAEDFFQRARRTNERLRDRDQKGRILGYLGLLQHLRGNLEDAEKSYKRACRKLRKERNQRGQAVFLGHYADLKIRQRDYATALRLSQLSRALAEAGQYPDLVAFARATQGNLYRSQGRLPDALREYDASMQTARRCGIRKLEVDILFGLSRVALALGDFERARQHAVGSLHLANALLLGLRQTKALVVLGKATVRAGQRQLGVAYLKHAARQAEQQQYLLRKLEAEECLYELGEFST